MTNFYSVTWKIDVMAESHEEAAKIALRIQHDANSAATVFDVKEFDTETTKRIDLIDQREKI